MEGDATTGLCPPALDGVLGGPAALGVLEGWTCPSHVRRRLGVDPAREFGPNVSRRSGSGLFEVDFLVLWNQLLTFWGEEERGCGRFWTPTHLV